MRCRPLQKTAADRFRRALKHIAEWCRKYRHEPVREQWAVLRRKLMGHFAYFGVIGNVKALQNLRYQAMRAWWKWLSRRSQKAHLSWVPTRACEHFTTESASQHNASYVLKNIRCTNRARPDPWEPRGRDPPKRPDWKTAEALDSTEKAKRAYDEAEQRARTKAGLDADEVAALAPAVGEVIMARLTAGQQEGAAQAMQKQMQEALAKLPADQRAEAGKEVGQILQGLKDLREAKDARQKYGDKAVDAILKHEAELTPLFRQGLGAPK